jgi:hypothetical protein
MASGRDDLAAAAALEAMIPLCAKSDSGAIELAQAFSNHPSPLRRQLAASALATAALKGVAPARQAVARMARDPNPSVRAATARALGETELARLLDDPSPKVRAACVRAAASLCGSALSRLPLESVMTGPSPSVRRALAAACEVLAARADQRALHILLELAASPAASQAAGEALAHAAAMTDGGEEIVVAAAWGDKPEKKLLCLKAALLEPRPLEAASLWLDLLTGSVQTATGAAAYLAKRSGMPALARRDCLAAARCLRVARVDDIGRCCRVVSRASPGLQRLSEAAALAHRACKTKHAETRARLLSAALSATSRALETADNLNPMARRVLKLICNVWMPLLETGLLALSASPDLEAELPVNRLLLVAESSVPIRVRNTGAGLAEFVSVSLGKEAVELGRLAPDEEKHAEMSLSGLIGPKRARPGAPRRTRSTVRELAVDVRFRALDGELRCLTFAKNVQLLTPSKTFRPPRNLYAPGKPLEPGSPLFFGRQEIFDFLRHVLISPQPRVVVALVGQRRCGKTSILNQLSRKLGDICCPVVIDAQGLGPAPAADFRYDLARAAQKGLGRAGLVADAPVEVEMRKGCDALLEYFDSASRVARPKTLLLAFDEFDELDRTVRQGLLPDQVFADLRYVLQHSSNVAFLLCGTHSLEELGASYWSFLFNLAVYKRIGSLEHEACLDLAVRPMEAGGVIVDDPAADAITELSGGQPYFIELVCHMLVEKLHSLKRNYLTARDIWHSATELAQAADVHLRYLWELAPPAGRALLCLMAHSATGMHLHELASKAEAHGLRIKAEELTRAMSQMQHDDLVAQTHLGYNISMGLLSHWIRANWRVEAAARLLGPPART